MQAYRQKFGQDPGYYPEGAYVAGQMLKQVLTKLGGRIEDREAFLKALGDKKGIRRFAHAYVPLDESLARVVVDLSGRNYIVYDVDARGMIGEFPAELAGEFFRAFSNAAKINLHIQVVYGRDLHHQVEAVFKACAVALRDAVAVNPEIQDVPSTKGTL